MTDKKELQATSHVIINSLVTAIVQHFAWLLIAVIALWAFNDKASRALDVLERMDQRVERAFVGAAPVGKAIVEKGVSGLSEIDAKDLANKATKRIGELIERKASDD